MLASIQAIILVTIYRKYSTNYLLSIFLFIASTDYLSWMFNGVRQFAAVTTVSYTHLDGVLTRDINDAIDALNQKEEKVIGCVFGNVYPGFGERIGNSYGYGYGYGTYSRAER